MHPPLLSHKAARFTESVIREMTRLAVQHKAVNLAQGFPDFPAPEILKNAALLGFWKVVVVDLDRIEESNLSRTILYRDQDIGESERGLDGRDERGGGGNFRNGYSLHLRSSAQRSAFLYEAVLRSANLYVGQSIRLHVHCGAVVYRL